MEKTTLERKQRKRHLRRPNTSIDQSCTASLAAFYHQELMRRVQQMAIRSDQDQVVRGRSGIELMIPALSFRDPITGMPTGGEITVTLIEMMDTTDMLLTKRPTTSGGALLETGGAFAFSARQNGRDLNLGNPITARVPFSARTTRPDLMSVFTAPSRPSPSFDWSPSRRDAILNAGQSRREGYYELRVNRPQWINCDYFFRRSRSNLAFTKISATSHAVFREQHAYLLFKDINAVAMMWPSRQHNQLSFRAPKGQEATIVMIAVEDDAFLLGTSDIHTSEGPDFYVPLEYTTQEEIRMRVEAITGR